VILYEDSRARQLASDFWHRVELDHPVEQEFDVNWLPVTFAHNAIDAAEAAEKAARADLVVFAVNLENDLADEIRSWIDSWLHRRGEREGAIVALTAQPHGPGAMAGAAEVYLRHVAHRAGMDYLSGTPPTVPMAIPDSLDSFCDRAGAKTSLLDEILRTQSLPPPPPRAQHST
jgi:hypothetical protein